MIYSVMVILLTQLRHYSIQELLDPQFSSCFLTGTGDSVDGIFKTITDCAKISKWAGGIRVHVSARKGYTSKKQDEIFPLKKGKFNNFEVFCPNKGENYLSRFYGNNWKTEYKVTHSHF